MRTRRKTHKTNTFSHRSFLDLCERIGDSSRNTQHAQQHTAQKHGPTADNNMMEWTEKHHVHGLAALTFPICRSDRTKKNNNRRTQKTRQIAGWIMYCLMFVRKCVFVLVIRIFMISTMYKCTRLCAFERRLCLCVTSVPLHNVRDCSSNYAPLWSNSMTYTFNGFWCIPVPG